MTSSQIFATWSDHIHSTWERLVARFERTSPLRGLIRRAADLCRVRNPPPRNGYRALVDVPVYTPEEYEALRADFERRLEAMVGFAERVGAIPIVPPANDSGFEPSRSFLPPETPRAERSAFARAFLVARALEESDVRSVTRLLSHRNI